MSSPREHPSRRLLILAEESAKLMWRTYELHHETVDRDAAWHQKRAELFAACDAADRRFWKLREQVAQENGAWFNPDYSDSD